MLQKIHRDGLLKFWTATPLALIATYMVLVFEKGFTGHCRHPHLSRLSQRKIIVVILSACPSD